MDDIISRQAAIDAILHITNCKSVRELFEYNQLHHLTEMWSGGVNDAIDAVIGVDSAQLGTNLAEVGTDCISRQVAIDAFDGVKVDEENCTEYDIGYNDGIDFAIRKLSVLPPAQPQRTGKCMWCERLKERNLRIEYYWIDEEGCTASFSEPHIVATGIAKFCPNCGAKITEGDAE